MNLKLNKLARIYLVPILIKHLINLVHCVSQDFGISKNIVLDLKNKYGEIDELMAQTKKIEQIAFFIFGNQFIIYYKLSSKAFMFNVN